ncbi:unnamed protein product [Mytilus coruscus]|uniref:Helitron helicase-like domain-containing protein n=1 Tax=Mytilus coruscus TaxID=42192 RepID=A0A6J8B3F1_MYTCO|nr:unnamed protein product [Mytilus coruscus]
MNIALRKSFTGATPNETLTAAADLKWTDTIQAIGRQRGIFMSDEKINNLSWNDKCAMLRSNPLTAARHFQFRLDCLFKDIILSKAKPLGEVSHYFYRIEFQQRGSPHWHGVIWIKDAPNPEESSLVSIETFIDKYIHSTLPSQEDDKELYDLVNFLQRHTHTSTCTKTGKMCRFNYPKPVTSKTVFARPSKSDKNPAEQSVKFKLAASILTRVKEFLHNTPEFETLSIEDVLTQCNVTEEEYLIQLVNSVKVPTVFMKRTPSDILINNYNPIILKARQANMDIHNTWDLLDPVIQQALAEERAEGEQLDPEFSFLDLGDNLDANHSKRPDTIPLPASNPSSITVETVSTIWTNEEYSSHIRSLNFEQRQCFQIVLDWCQRLDELFQSKYDFGGISVSAFRDLYLLPPIGQGFVFQQPSDEYARLTVNLWENFRLFNLTKIMRQRQDAKFAQMLNRVREAKFTDEDIEVLESRCIDKSKATGHLTLYIYLHGMNRSIVTMILC